MQFKRLSLLAFVAGALAANNSTLTVATPSVTKACSFSDFTATNQAELATVTACTDVVGDITVMGDEFGSVDLTGVQRIFGDFVVSNATLAVAVNAPTLQLISGSFSLDRLTILATLNLAQLTTVGSLNFTALPALEQTGLATGITSADNIEISDTGLTSLAGIEVSQVKIFNINNNKDIETIDTALEYVTDLLSISYNAEKVDVTLDQLLSANQVLFQSIASLSISNLTTVNDTLSILQNSFGSFEFPALTSVAKSLSINENDDLTSFDFPELVTIGGAFVVGNNSELTDLDAFAKLRTVGGAVTLQGDFDNATFPHLNSIKGGFSLLSTGDLSCASFDQLNKDGDIQGDKYVCSGASSSTSSSSDKSGSTQTSSGSDSTSSSSSSSSASASSTKSSAASPAVGVNTALLFGAVFAGFSVVVGSTLL